MNNETISVIVPVYNAAVNLEKCIRSIMAQSYKNIEIILVDDGSTDVSGKICDRLATEDSRIRVLHKKNEGPGSARNTGIAEASGKYLAFVDSDDFLNEKMFEILEKTAENKSADAVICGFQYYYGDNIYNEVINCAGDGVRVISGRDASLEYFNGSDEMQYFIVAWNKLYKRQLFSGMLFPARHLHEDEDFTLRLLYPAERIALVPFIGYYYRVEENESIMGSFNEKRFQLIDAYLIRMAFYASHGEKELWQKTLILAMHMFEQLVYWKSLATKRGKYIPGSENSPEEFYRKKITEAAIQNEWLRGRVKIELMMFAKKPDLYKRLWESLNYRRKPIYGTREFL